MTVTINGRPQAIRPGESLIDLINRCGIEVPQVCYHPQLGPIQTCDTCMVEVDGKLVASLRHHRRGRHECGDGLGARGRGAARSIRSHPRQSHALLHGVRQQQRQLHGPQHDQRCFSVEHQKIPYKPKPYEVDMSNPFYRYDPDQCILCGRCVEACQNLQVNETLSINWEDPAPARAVGRRSADRRIELRFVRALRHRLPLQCADGKVDAWRGWLLHCPAQARARRDDRYGEGH